MPVAGKPKNSASFTELLGQFASTLIGGVAGAFTIECVWNWYLVPVFALHVINGMQSYGLMIALALFRGKRPNLETTVSKDTQAMLFHLLAVWLMIGTLHLAGLIL